MSKEIIWQPSKEQISNSKLTKFIQHCKLNNYDELEKKSFSDPGWLWDNVCLLYTSPSPRDFEASRMPSSA